MGSGTARRITRLTLAGALVLLIALTAERKAEAVGWGPCRQRDDLCKYYLNVATRQGQARLSVDQTCRGDWRHAWRRPDARRTIEQWLDGTALAGFQTPEWHSPMLFTKLETHSVFTAMRCYQHCCSLPAMGFLPYAVPPTELW